MFSLYYSDRSPKIRDFPNQRHKSCLIFVAPPNPTSPSPSFYCHYARYRFLFKFLVQAGGHLIADWIKYCRLQLRFSLKVQVEHYA